MLSHRNIRYLSTRGAALIAALALTTALTLGFGIALTVILKRYAIVVQDEFHLQAARLAESGSFIRIPQLRHNQRFPDTILVGADRSIERSLEPWGPTYRLTSIGKVSAVSELMISILGRPLSSNLDAAVVVTDPRYPLTLSGTAFIEGTIRCGPAGIQNGSLSGGVGDTLQKYRGRIESQMTATIPDLDMSVIDAYEIEQSNRKRAAVVIPGSITWRESTIFPTDSMLSVEDNAELINTVQPKGLSVKNLFVGRRLSVSGRTRINSVQEIVAGESIRLTDSAQITNVLMVAEDSIVIEGDAFFSGVMICRGVIRVRERGAIRWPSLIVTCPRSLDTSRSRIFISSTKHSEGLFFAGKLAVDSLTVPLISIDSQTIVAGYLLSQGEVELRGLVYGKVMTERFRFVQGSSTYVNWIYQGRIRDLALPFVPLLPALVGSDAKALQPLNLVKEIP